MDQRHLVRIKTVQNLFAYTYNTGKIHYPYPEDKKILLILKNLEGIDKLIKQFAPRYPIERIAKVDLSILRLSIYELTFEKKIPEKVVINEAIELSKELSGENSYAFINAVLGKILNYAKASK